MKKISAVLITCALVATCLALAGCGGKSGTASISAAASDVMGTPNPVHEVTQDGVLAATGLQIAAPEGAQDEVYSFIDTDSENAIAQVVYKDANGTEWTYRIQAGGGTEAEDISGTYFEWAEQEEGMVTNRAAVASVCDEGSLVTWFDVVPGVNYSLFANSKLAPADLFVAAEKVFKPVQG